MIAIIAEKPSVGQDIARVIGATEKKDGYMAGNGYLVTWALGHLVSLAMPSAYGYGKASHEAGELETLLRGEKTGVVSLSLVLLGVDVVMDATLQLVRKNDSPLLEIIGINPTQ